MEKILVIGATIVDIMMYIDALPSSGDDIVASNELVSVGGCALNVANVLRAFDVPFDLLSPIGVGKNAELIRQSLTQKNIDILLDVGQADNGHCLTLVEKSGERTFITLLGVESNISPNWFDVINPLDYTKVYVCGYDIEADTNNAILNFLEHNSHLELIFAPSPRITYIQKSKINKMFKLSKFIHLNKPEILNFTNKLTVEDAVLALDTDATIVVTLGPEGTILYNKKTFITITTQAVTPIDTSGAGDSHLGGFIVGLALGKSHIRATNLAHNIAKQVVQTKGSEFIKKQGESYE
ncbi:MAG: hypothetical protein ATN35_01220 [Epulopiscium sp. Nele67-Bin004]|nr:MAG: hypothetical protein ATN35_01220 [Epulopiscium sp. Nele67-Bin004]